MSAISIPTIFTAVDNYSGAVNKMGESTQKFGAKATSMSSKFDNVADSAGNVAKKSAVIGAVISAPLMLAAKSAIDFEDKMADVAKVTDTKIGSAQFKALGDEAKKLSHNLAIPAQEAAGLMANLAQGGVAVEDLSNVASIAGEVGVAFGISADYAGDAFIKTKNALGGTIESTKALMDTINMLSDSTASSAPQILSFMAAGGSGAARALNATGESMAALGAAMISQGVSAEESATVMERFTKTVLSSKTLLADFKKAGGGTEGMMAILAKGASLAGTAQDEYFSQFGAYGLKLQLLAKNFDQVEKSVLSASNEQLTAGSVQKEFANRSSTVGFAMKQAQADIENLSIEIGDTLLPVIRDFLKEVTPMLASFQKWAKENPKTLSAIIKTAAAIGALSLGISGVATMVSGAASIFSLLAKTIGFLAPIIMNYVVPSFQIVWAVVVSFLEILAAAAGVSFGALVGWIVAIGLMLWSLWENWDKIVQAFTDGGILNGIMAIGVAILDMILLPIQKILETVDALSGTNMGASLQSFRDDMWATVAPTNNQAAQTEAVKESVQTNNANVNLNVNDPKGRLSVASASDGVNVRLGSTMSME